MPALQKVFHDLKTDLKIDWATHEAAKHAVENWHYSKCMPKSKLAKFGVWESGKFIGVVVYGVGATSDLVKHYGLKMEQGCELVRIALRNHQSPVSRIIAISICLLKKTFPGLRLVVSFADPEQGHHGGVYQASGWLFSGNTQASDEYVYKGKRWQGRSFRNKFKGMEKHPSVKIVKGSSKHRYLMPLDPEMRKQILPLSKPYPKRAAKQPVDCAPTNRIASLGAGTHPEKPKRAASETVDTPPDQGGKGGSIPTAALHS